MPAPGAGYGPAVGQLDAVEALKYGWAAFTKNLGPYLVVTLASLALLAAISVGGMLLDGGFNAAVETADPDNPFAGAFSPWSTVANIVTTVIGSVISVGMLRMSFDVLDGRKAELGRLFQGYPVGAAILVSIIVGVLTSVGMMLCILPGIVAAVALVFATSHAVDHGRGIGESLTGSLNLVKDNLGPVIIWLLLALVAAIIGVCCTLGLGLLVVGPVISISTAYAYRVLTGGQVRTPA
ncbi:DUF2189 domain-containing protein [Marihabitans asiaticum]|uniref:Integral membrane protein n=1 Tax=Marihabitans asiaticum TaxID=415218 RepID=A0A560WGV0_9MICO|nr:hypothetical protein [Marihabitans asiaticum]TWD16897.1 hypothetical protein FB557_0443 [Marihabitans asiaticum]